tara:strand:+ start:1803 stop:2888 length:1086 start_codon:yes stop_codon:yes gene_type:complete
VAILATQTGAQPVLQQLPQPYSQANSQLYSQLYSQPGRLRIALWHTGLGRRGPGLFLQDIRREAPDILAAYDTLVALAPDVLILLDMDFDHDGMALAAFADALAGAGLDLPYRFAPRPNTGMATGVDMDGDGRLGTADDAQGWARFAGSGGIALLSRWPLDIGTLRDNSTYLWRDLPGTQLPMQGGQPFPNAAVFDIQRLASTGAWEIGVTAPGQRLTVMTWHAGPPAFGGAQARNRLRNAAENDFWRLRLDGALGPAPQTPFVLLGDANLDPARGDGDGAVISRLLAHPSLQDPAPTAPLPPAGVPPDATANWPDGPGALREQYLLPSADLRVLDAGVIWPDETATHALLWADLAWPPRP